MRVCLDTNVIIDILGKTQDLSDSYAAFDVSLLRGFEVFVPVTSTTDIAYILPRRNLASKQEAKQLLADLMAVAGILDARQVDVECALESSMDDYEDALLASMALRNRIDLIITRNIRDFENSPVPAISPRRFVEIYKPSGYEYSSLGIS
ncbi:MAG: PIN domain-containing protein [Coriobacteriia bacterium]|nr:PIN domain-containing protein [Coriobacteriia bacterium]